MISENNINELKGNRTFPLGVLENWELEKYDKIYKTDHIILPEKSKLLLFTDGLTEATSENNRDLFYDEEGLFQAIGKFRELPCKLFIEEMFKSLQLFRGSDQFEDDVCFVCVDVD